MAAPCQIGVNLLKPTDILVAAPRVRDSRFRGCVLIVLSSSPSSGSIALCLNQRMDLTTDDLDEFDSPGPRMCHDIHWGGPTSPESVWLIHDESWRSDNTLAVGPGIRVSSDRAMIEEITQGRGPAEFRLMAGFTSWRPGELEQELARSVGYGEQAQYESDALKEAEGFKTALEDMKNGVFGRLLPIGNFYP